MIAGGTIGRSVRRRRGPAAAALFMVGALVGVTGCAASPSGAINPTPDQTRTVVQNVHVVLVGSSDTLGTACGGQGPANWTEALAAAFVGSPVTFAVAKSAGAGYSAAGTDGKTFLDLVRGAVTPVTTVVVLLQGGEDAADPLRVDDRSDAAYRAILGVSPKAQVLTVGPYWTGPGPAPTEMEIVKQGVTAAAQRNGVKVLSAATWISKGPSLSCAASGGLTDEGQREVARRVGDALRVLLAI